MNNLLQLAKSLNLIDEIEVEAPGVEVTESKRRKQRRNRNKTREPDPFKYILCLDFEGTCWDRPDQAKWKTQELIEFPAVLVELETGEVLAEFREYLKPVEFPALSDFCVNLTGITQQMVNEGISIQSCLMKFDLWLKWQIKKYDLKLPKMRENDPGNCALSAWTDWDSIVLSKECARKKIRKASYFGQWMDARVIFMKRYLHKPKSFNAALNHCGLKFEGQPHSGLDDAKNLARLVVKMRKDGARFHITKDNFPHQKVNKPF